MNEMYICSKCGKEKPIDDFRTYKRRGKTSRRSDCRICERAWDKERSKTKVVKEEHRVARNIRRKEQRAIDPIMRLTNNVQRRIRVALEKTSETKGYKVERAAEYIELIGCTYAQLMDYLESQFMEGMTRDNYGEVWVQDHIRACASFDLSDPLQQRECFHYSNMAPDTPDDNKSKHSEYNGKRWTYGMHKE